MEYLVHMAYSIIALALNAFALFLQLIIGVLTFLVELVRRLFGVVF